MFTVLIIVSLPRICVCIFKILNINMQPHSAAVSPFELLLLGLIAQLCGSMRKHSACLCCIALLMLYAAKGMDGPGDSKPPNDEWNSEGDWYSGGWNSGGSGWNSGGSGWNSGGWWDSHQWKSGWSDASWEHVDMDELQMPPLTRQEKQDIKKKQALDAYRAMLLAKGAGASSSNAEQPPPPPPSCVATAGSCGLVSPPPLPPPSCVATAGSCGQVSHPPPPPPGPPPGCDATAGSRRRGRKKSDKACDGGDSSSSSDDIIWYDRPFEDHRIPPCDTCGNQVSWKLQEHADTLLEQLPNGKQIYTRFYHCSECKAKEWDCTVGEAQRRIIDEKPSNKRRAERARKFKEADEQAAVDFPALTTKNKRRMITIASFCEVIEDLYEFIEAKRTVFRKRGQLLKEHQELLLKVEQCSTFEEMRVLSPQLLALQEQIEQQEEFLAFKSRGADQGDFCRAADYDDTWTVRYDSAGKVISALRSWWICLAGHETTPCCTLILAKHWNRKINKPDGEWVKGQKWQCNCCNTKYKTTYGVLVEIIIKGTPYWCVAEEPGEMRDIKYMRVERDNRNVTSAKELFNNIKDVHPVTSDIMRPATPHECWYGSHEGVYKIINLPELNKQPKWQWTSLMSYADHMGSKK